MSVLLGAIFKIILTIVLALLADYLFWVVLLKRRGRVKRYKTLWSSFIFLINLALGTNFKDGFDEKENISRNNNKEERRFQSEGERLVASVDRDKDLVIQDSGYTKNMLDVDLKSYVDRHAKVKDILVEVVSGHETLFAGYSNDMFRTNRYREGDGVWKWEVVRNHKTGATFHRLYIK